MPVRELRCERERREAVPILQQLWTDRSAEEVLAWTGEEDYHLFGAFDDGDDGDGGDDELVGVAGVLVTHLLHHERHAWLYDLVVDEPRRGEGHGGRLVEFVESWARERDCECVALGSPLAKEGVHEFYGSRGYERWGYVLEKRL